MCMYITIECPNVAYLYTCNWIRCVGMIVVVGLMEVLSLCHLPLQLQKMLLLELF